MNLHEKKEAASTFKELISWILGLEWRSDQVESQKRVFYFLFLKEQANYLVTK